MVLTENMSTNLDNEFTELNHILTQFVLHATNLVQTTVL